METLYDEMVAAGIAPNDFTYFQLLLASKRNERPDRAVLWSFAVWNHHEYVLLVSGNTLVTL